MNLEAQKLDREHVTQKLTEMQESGWFGSLEIIMEGGVIQMLQEHRKTWPPSRKKK